LHWALHGKSQYGGERLLETALLRFELGMFGNYESILYVERCSREEAQQIDVTNKNKSALSTKPISSLSSHIGERSFLTERMSLVPED
jgi:hypothetical protein